MKEEIYNILGKYIDLGYKEEHKNIKDINVEQYFDGIDNSNNYFNELKQIGFHSLPTRFSYVNQLFSEKHLCGISYCEGDVSVVWYKDLTELNSEKKRTLEFYNQ